MVPRTKLAGQIVSTGVARCKAFVNLSIGISRNTVAKPRDSRGRGRRGMR
jgi:hypothetical protein